MRVDEDINKLKGCMEECEEAMNSLTRAQDCFRQLPDVANRDRLVLLNQHALDCVHSTLKMTENVLMEMCIRGLKT